MRQNEQFTMFDYTYKVPISVILSEGAAGIGGVGGGDEGREA